MVPPASWLGFTCSFHDSFHTSVSLVNVSYAAAMRLHCIKLIESDYKYASCEYICVVFFLLFIIIYSNLHVYSL